MTALATIHKILYCPIVIKQVVIPTPEPLMRLGRTLGRPVTTEQTVSAIGVALFAFAILCVVSEDPAFTPAILFLLHSAAWFVTGGWLLRRHREALWPFHNPAFARFAKNVVSKILYTLNVIVLSLGVAAIILLLMAARMGLGR